ncbi:hypothetical protein [Streptomyces poonensis]|uniref:Uncharacterized protein n=1 Tax=Streptomyces poonensis TaxID=68255 RepID=A0A918UWD1_9ACTN|nr:hypothetical protein [Streptomyces poonensis]GGZ39177.1 hypothetical protein GCM10010365_69900 [Streptomyces poonensis]GLJ93118.1 hypothetical protein GCM10017589_57300 [Streptomyces poonensis]
MDTMLPGSGSADPSAAAAPRLTFRVPPAFFELPVQEAPEELGEALAELAQDVYPEGNAELWFQYVAAQLPLVIEMMEAGVSYAGFCLLDLDGRRSTATVTATLLESVPGGEKATASSVAAELAGSGDQVHVETVWLAAGEAVARFTSEITTLPAEITDSGRSEEVEIGKIAVFVPLRRDAEMALFELSTPCMQDWDLYSELFFNIVNTLEVNDAGTPVEDPRPQQSEGVPPSRPESVLPGRPTDVAGGVEVPLRTKSVRDVFG